MAAFIGEPVSMSAGTHIPHPDYWPTIREICDKHGVIMICDEVITGFGRTGKMFATEHWGVQPDITTVAKALTSGYLPIGGAIARKSIADAFIGDEDTTFNSGHLITFGGNPRPARPDWPTSTSWKARAWSRTPPRWETTSTNASRRCTSTASSATCEEAWGC